LNNSNEYQDKELFTRIEAGDPVAFQQLFSRHYQALYQNAFKLLKSGFWAEEVTQETLLHIWESRDTLSEIENPAAWLFRIVANKCRNRIRRQEIEVKAQYMIAKAAHENQQVRQEESYDYSVLRSLITEAVDRLPEQQKLVYKLQQDQELSYKEMAEQLGISPNTVRNHLVRAFSAIRDHLISHGGFRAVFIAFLFFPKN